MQLVKGNLWYWHGLGKHVGITTNADINRRQELVMGRGVALEAKRRFPDLAVTLANHVIHHGNVPCYVAKDRLFTVPVKQHYLAKAEISIILRSLSILDEILVTLVISEVYIPMPGCGAGGLKREDVLPVIEAARYSDRILITEIFL